MPIDVPPKRSNQVAATSSTKAIVANSIPRTSNSINNATSLVTFQYEETCVLVKLAASYQEAQGIAKQEFFELKDVAKERIGFVIVEPTSGSAKAPRKELRISESAWSTVTSQMPQVQTLHIIVLPDPDAKGPPPQYLEVPTPDLRHSRSDLSRPSSRLSTRSGNGFLSWIGSGK